MIFPFESTLCRKRDLNVKINPLAAKGACCGQIIPDRGRSDAPLANGVADLVKPEDHVPRSIQAWYAGPLVSIDHEAALFGTVRAELPRKFRANIQAKCWI